MSDGTNSASAARAGDLPLDDAHRAHEEADRAKETFLIALCAGVTSFLFLAIVGLDEYAVALALVVAILDRGRSASDPRGVAAQGRGRLTVRSAWA